MIYLILKSYLAIFISVGLGSLALFVVGAYFLLKRPKKRDEQVCAAIVSEPRKSYVGSGLQKTVLTSADKVKSISITSSDITAIAGDDVVATQLDLARAYIETGRKQLAKRILEFVLEQGSDKQRQEAHRLMGFI